MWVAFALVAYPFVGTLAAPLGAKPLVEGAFLLSWEVGEPLGFPLVGASLVEVGVHQEEGVPWGAFQLGGVPGIAHLGEGVPGEFHQVMDHDQGVGRAEGVLLDSGVHQEDLDQMALVGSGEMAF